MKKRIIALAALICNSLVFIFSVYSISMFFTGSGDSFMTVSKFVCFRYFTIDSNVLCAITCLAALPACIKGISGKEYALSRPVLLARFIGTAAVTVTLLTVIFFLGPTMGYGHMFTGPSLWLHGVNPVLAIITLLEGREGVYLRNAWLAVMPVAVYACFYLPLVVILKIWPDFYGFNVGGLWYVSAPVMLAAAYLIGLALSAMRRSGPLHRALYE